MNKEVNKMYKKQNIKWAKIKGIKLENQHKKHEKQHVNLSVSLTKIPS